MWRIVFYGFVVAVLAAIATLGFNGVALGHGWPLALVIVLLAIVLIGFADVLSPSNVLRNYPVIGHLRYMMEFISPEIRQYFLEDDKNGRPYNRSQRDLIQQRANNKEGSHAFGTEYDLLDNGYDFAVHSIVTRQVPQTAERIVVGGPQCSQPYDSSRLNISAMSFGALSMRAVLAMNKGAALGGFAQDTGEGGLTPYHLEYGADVIWEIGSGYFGCRNAEGHFDDEEFRKKALHEKVRMIEIKISQGAKPGHGGLLPAAKVTPEIAKIRQVPVHQDCLSPANHAEFDSPRALLDFVARLRRLCDGKPVGFKLCIGRKSEFLGICKAMVETGILPDFITIDGAEGGTGAAPQELSDKMGLAINEALPFVHSALLGVGVREHIRLIASGRIVTGFDIVHKLAIGADICNVARPMMFAVGCIQSMRCDSGTCPTGVATQDKKRGRAIDVELRGQHVANYHRATIKSFKTVLGVIGVSTPDLLTPAHISHRMPDGRALPYDEVFDYLQPRQLLDGEIPKSFARDWAEASATRF